MPLTIFLLDELPCNSRDLNMKFGFDIAMPGGYWE